MMVEMGRGSIRSQSVENSRWKRLLTRHKTGYMINRQSNNHVNLRCSYLFYGRKCLHDGHVVLKASASKCFCRAFLTFCCRFLQLLHQRKNISATNISAKLSANDVQH